MVAYGFSDESSAAHCLQPYNHQYKWDNSSDNLVIEDRTISKFNTYLGGVYQQATSVVTKTSA